MQFRGGGWEGGGAGGHGTLRLQWQKAVSHFRTHALTHSRTNALTHFSVPAKIIDGTAIAREIRAEVAAEAAQLRAEGTIPGLAVVLVGNDASSEVYVQNKARACHEAGMHDRL